MDQLRHMFQRDVSMWLFVVNFKIIFSISSSSGRDVIYCPAIANAFTLCAINPNIMIEKERRKKLAFHLRQLSVGVTTNDDSKEAVTEDVSDGWLPEQYYRSKRLDSDLEDPIIRPMLELCWGLYDDTRQYKLTKSDKLSEQGLKIIARCILFLHSDKEYEWPYFNTNNQILGFSLKDLVLSVLTLGHHNRNKREEHMMSCYDWQKLGEYDVWPFFRKYDYENQLKRQPFLSGRPTTGA
jgi:hypothetical protein